jgi:hypothetical protein
MRLGHLQRFILLRAFENRGRLARRGLEVFYKTQTAPPKRKDQIGAVTHTLERMLSLGLLTALCVRTAEKWFIKEVRLTARGRKEALRLFGEQQKLPLQKSR